MTTHVFGLHLVVVLILFLHTVHGTQKSMSYKHVASLDNKLCTTQSQSFSTKTQSSIQCGNMCVGKTDCDRFFYSEATNDCVGCVPFSSYRCPTCTEEATGTLHYRRLSRIDCFSIRMSNPSAPSGIYTVQLSSNRGLDVYCDMDTSGGGWTVLQYRYDGTVDFYRTFEEYTDGFGDVGGEFWLGLQNIHEMASPDIHNQIYLYLDDGNSQSHVDKAFRFSLGNGPCYESYLSIGDEDLIFNTGVCFSAKDYGDEMYCATDRRSGWWHSGLGDGNCTLINPNGLYVTPGTLVTSPSDTAGLTHYPWKQGVSLATSKIMFRRVVAMVL